MVNHHKVALEEERATDRREVFSHGVNKSSGAHSTEAKVTTESRNDEKKRARDWDIAKSRQEKSSANSRRTSAQNSTRNARRG